MKRNFLILGTLCHLMSLSAAEKIIANDFLEKMHQDTQPLTTYVKKSTHKEFLRSSDFSHGKKISVPHENNVHFQGIIKDKTLLHCRYIVGGCFYTKAACAFLAHHAEQSSLASIKCCTEEDFFNILRLSQSEKTEHQNCLLLGFQVLKKGMFPQSLPPSSQETQSPLLVRSTQQSQTPEPSSEEGALEFFKKYGTILLEEILDLTESHY